MTIRSEFFSGIPLRNLLTQKRNLLCFTSAQTMSASNGLLNSSTLDPLNHASAAAFNFHLSANFSSYSRIDWVPKTEL